MKPRDIDEYLAGVEPVRRAALQRLRRIILAALPGGEECISYRIPAFRREGSVVAGFAVTGQGCSYYPFSGRTLATLADALGDRSRTRSALHFTPEEPLPPALVRKLLRARLEEVRAARPARRPVTRRAAPGRRKRPAPRR